MSRLSPRGRHGDCIDRPRGHTHSMDNIQCGTEHQSAGSLALLDTPQVPSARPIDSLGGIKPISSVVIILSV